MKAFVQWLRIFLLLSFVLSLVIGVFAISVYKDLKAHNDVVLTAVRDSLAQYQAREKRLDNMAKALLINYTVSEYEARYYAYIIDEFSSKYEIPWEIYAALVRYESNFNPGLTSNKGCRGLTQISETVAKDMCKKLGIRYYKEIYWNDMLNLVLGFEYLSEGIKEKDILHGVRRYVGGSGYRINVTKSRETRTYVGEYGTTIPREFERMRSIFRGVQATAKEDSSEVAVDTVEETN